MSFTEQQKNARNKIGDREDRVLVFGIHRYKGQAIYNNAEAPDEHLNVSPNLPLSLTRKGQTE